MWFRNVKLYANELAELGCKNTVWARFQAKKARIDPVKFAEMKFGKGSGFQVIVVDEYDAVLYRDGQDKPAGVFPVWNATHDEWGDLIRYIEKPWGADLDRCLAVEYEEEHRPVWKQNHIVVVTGIGDLRDPMWVNTLDNLSELQALHPEVTLFMHQLSKFPPIFGREFKMADYDARFLAAKGRVVIPAGREISPELLSRLPMWAKILGYTPAQLSVPRNRCLFNIKAVMWAARHYKGLDKFVVRDGGNPDWRSPTLIAQVQTSSYTMSGRQVPQPGDKIACDQCTLWASCKFYRAKAVCAVPESEMKGVAALFKTRDSADIIKAMGKLLAVNADRIEVGLDNEAKNAAAADEGSGIDPALSKLINDTMSSAEKLAKLIDPRLTPAGAKVQINMTGGNAQVGQGPGPGADPRELSRILIDQIEATGVPRDQITPEMITAAAQALTGKSNPLVIEGGTA